MFSTPVQFRAFVSTPSFKAFNSSITMDFKVNYLIIDSQMINQKFFLIN